MRRLASFLFAAASASLLVGAADNDLLGRRVVADPGLLPMLLVAGVLVSIAAMLLLLMPGRRR